MARKKTAAKPVKNDSFDKIYVKVKFEQKEYFKAMFPDTVWRRGKGWEIKDSLENHRKLDEWNAQAQSLGENETLDAIKKITEGITTLGKKIEELDSKVKILIETKEKNNE